MRPLRGGGNSSVGSHRSVVAGVGGIESYSRALCGVAVPGVVFAIVRRLFSRIWRWLSEFDTALSLLERLLVVITPTGVFALVGGIISDNLDVALIVGGCVSASFVMLLVGFKLGRMRERREAQSMLGSAAIDPDTMREDRKSVIRRWRRYAESYKRDLAREDWEKSESLDEIPSTSWYRSMRPHLSEETKRRLESGFRIEPAVSVGYRRTDIDRILDEIARIEKEWGLL